MGRIHVLSLLVSCVLSSAPAGPWDAFHYAPDSRTVRPRAIFKAEGNVVDADKLVNNGGSATLSGKGSWLTLDFGLEIGGPISLNFDSVTPSSSIALSFTESSLFVRPDASDDSSQCSRSTRYDGVEPVDAPLPQGSWTQAKPRHRGGFRYLTIVQTSDDPVTLSNVICTLSFMPHTPNLRDYSGYFYAKDPVYHDEDFLTKVWYAGAYTLQTNTIPSDTGRHWPLVGSPGWANDAQILPELGPVIVDGAKRDRTVWPGDTGIAIPVVFVSTNDLVSIKNTLNSIYGLIKKDTGELPFIGPPIGPAYGSDAYHSWTLVGTHNYYIYSGDREWLDAHWDDYTSAVAFLQRKVDSSGLMERSGWEDWARLNSGGHNAAMNAILYKVLTDAANLATLTDRGDLANQYTQSAAALKKAYNDLLWDDAQGQYRDNPETSLTAQDANSWAVLFGLTNDLNQARRVSDGLTRNWNDIGAVCPELPNTISPFISGFEIQAHFEVGNDERALDLLRREWGYMLYTDISVQSTLVEGFTANGSLGYREDTGYDWDPAYTSHAHGWSTGPTSALTFYVGGLSPVGPKGATWRFAPHTSGLSAAQTGFETPLGRFDAEWNITGDTFTAKITSPQGTQGSVDLSHVVWPRNKEAAQVFVGGKMIAKGLSAPVTVEGGVVELAIRLPESTCNPKRGRFKTRKA
ncbi:glycoside hydrolase family 78 protein [Auricularia subglabra TFB-10046 SS5]|nr:glycoside hydrolase family 78 protein [Auricularia subglabra TFB-10046 SS5]